MDVIKLKFIANRISLEAILVIKAPKVVWVITQKITANINIASSKLKHNVIILNFIFLIHQVKSSVGAMDINLIRFF